MRSSAILLPCATNPDHAPTCTNMGPSKAQHSSMAFFNTARVGKYKHAVPVCILQLDPRCGWRPLPWQCWLPAPARLSAGHSGLRHTARALTHLASAGRQPPAVVPVLGKAHRHDHSTLPAGHSLQPCQSVRSVSQPCIPHGGTTSWDFGWGRNCVPWLVSLTYMLPGSTGNAPCVDHTQAASHTMDGWHTRRIPSSSHTVGGIQVAFLACLARNLTLTLTH